MASVRTKKRINLAALFEEFGQEADVSVRPRIVGQEIVKHQVLRPARTPEERERSDERGLLEEEIEESRDIVEPVLLDSDDEKEIVVTVRGDGTPVTQKELLSAISANKFPQSAPLSIREEIASASSLEELKEVLLTRVFPETD